MANKLFQAEAGYSSGNREGGCHGDRQEREFKILAHGKSAQTYNNARHSLHGIFKALTHTAHLTVNPFDVVPTKSARYTSYRPLTITEISKILKTAPEHWRVAVLIALYTRLRFVDVCFLKWGTVDLNKGIIEVEPEKTKRLTKKIRIPIHPELAKELVRRKREKTYCPADNGQEIPCAKLSVGIHQHPCDLRHKGFF